MKIHFATPLDGALWAVSHLGVAVFPCKPGEKVPCIDAWPKNASRDHAMIRAWADAYPDCNYASPTAGFVATDIDTSKGDAAYDSLTALAAKLDMSCCVRTPSGGLHVWSKGDAAKRKLPAFPFVDFQATGQYVVLPGSRTEKGTYWVEADGPVPATPQWLLDALGAPVAADAPKVALGQGVEWDLPGNVEAARRAAAEWPAAVENVGSDDCCYGLALKFRDLAITPETSLAIWQELFVPRCEFSETDGIDNDVWLARKIASAHNSGQNPVGHKSVADVFAPVALKANPTEIADAAAKEKLAKLFYRPLMGEIKTADRWRVYGVLPQRGTMMLAGASGAGKTFVIFDLIRRLTTDTHWFGKKIDKQCGVLYVAGEDGGSTVERAAAAFHGVDFDKLKVPFLAIDGSPKDLLTPEGLAAFFVTIKAAKAELEADGQTLGLIVLDTLAAVFAIQDENSSADASKVTNAMKAIEKEFGVLVCCVHHHGKDASKGMRGSNAYFANVDIVLSVHDKTVTSLKVRNGVTGVVGEFNLVPVALCNDDDKRPITSMQVVPKPGLGDAITDIATAGEETPFLQAFNAVDLEGKGVAPLGQVLKSLAGMQNATPDDAGFLKRYGVMRDTELTALRLTVRGQTVCRISVAEP